MTVPLPRNGNFFKFTADSIIKESPHYIAVAKPPFTICQDELKNPTSLSNHLRASFPSLYEPKEHPFHAPKGVHRLDALVTGCVLYGTSVYGTRQLAKGFKLRKIKKGYLALLSKPSNMRNHVVDLEDHGKITSSDRSTHWHILARLESKAKGGGMIYVCWLSPLEGKNHQLRIHAAEDLHAPVIFDRRYGTGQPCETAGGALNGGHLQDPSEGIALHCASMQFPLGLEQKVVRCLPPNIGIWSSIAQEHGIDWEDVVNRGSAYQYRDEAPSPS